MNKKVLIIDDDVDICLLLNRYLTNHGFQVSDAFNGNKALEMLKKSTYDVILCDYRLPDTDGLDLLKKLKVLNPDVQVIIITGYSDVRMAVQTIKQGAYDYITKPLYHEEILDKVKNAANKQPKESASQGEKNFIIGKSQSAVELYKHIDLVAPTDMSVIIEGETGTGKEAVARRLHDKSKRSHQPFVAIDCGALPNELAGSELFGHEKGAFTGAVTSKTGHFETAKGGTLFLDEIGNLSYEVQVKLLRALQEQVIHKVGGTKDIKTDVRIIVATNEPLKKAVKENTFREDLFHRINEFRLQVAPLRERQEDIPLFAHHFLTLSNKELNKNVEEFDKDVMEVLKHYTWSGNLRELRNVIKRAVLLSPDKTATMAALPEEVKEGKSDLVFSDENGHCENDLKAASYNAEYQVIKSALDEAENNKTKAAKLLKIDRKTLYNKMKALNIES